MPRRLRMSAARRDGCTRCTTLSIPFSPMATRVMVKKSPSWALAGPAMRLDGTPVAARGNRWRYVHRPGSAQENSVRRPPRAPSTSTRSSPTSRPRALKHRASGSGSPQGYGRGWPLEIVDDLLEGGRGEHRGVALAAEDELGVAAAAAGAASGAFLGATAACVHPLRGLSGAPRSACAARTSARRGRAIGSESSASPSSGAKTLRTSMRGPRPEAETSGGAAARGWLLGAGGGARVDAVVAERLGAEVGLRLERFRIVQRNESETALAHAHADVLLLRRADRGEDVHKVTDVLHPSVEHVVVHRERRTAPCHASLKCEAKREKWAYLRKAGGCDEMTSSDNDDDRRRNRARVRARASEVASGLNIPVVCFGGTRDVRQLRARATADANSFVARVHRAYSRVDFYSRVDVSRARLVSDDPRRPSRIPRRSGHTSPRLLRSARALASLTPGARPSLRTMSGAGGDSGGSSAARAGIFLAGSLLGMAFAGGGALALSYLARAARRPPERRPARPRPAFRHAPAPSPPTRRRHRRTPPTRPPPQTQGPGGPPPAAPPGGRDSDRVPSARAPRGQGPRPGPSSHRQPVHRSIADAAAAHAAAVLADVSTTDGLSTDAPAYDSPGVVANAQTRRRRGGGGGPRTPYRRETRAPNQRWTLPPNASTAAAPSRVRPGSRHAPAGAGAGWRSRSPSAAKSAHSMAAASRGDAIPATAGDASNAPSSPNSRMKTTDSWRRCAWWRRPGVRARAFGDFDLDDEGGEGARGRRYRRRVPTSALGFESWRFARWSAERRSRADVRGDGGAAGAAATPNATGNPALRGDATLGIEPGSVPSTMDGFGVPATGGNTRSQNAAGRDWRRRTIPPIARWRARSKDSFHGAAGSDDVAAATADVRVVGELAVRRLGRSRGDVAVAFAFALRVRREASAEFSARRGTEASSSSTSRTSADAG